jgi:hypothetical protein
MTITTPAKKFILPGTRYTYVKVPVYLGAFP